MSETGAFEHGRMWWPFLVITALVAMIYVAIRLRRKGKAASADAIFRLTFMPHIWRRTTFLVDLKIYLVNKLFWILLNAAFVGMLGVVSLSTARFLGAEPVATPFVTYGALTCALVTVLIVMAHDFAAYVAHALGHKVPALWAFHRLHHSAERLTPITASRKHPVESLVQKMMVVFVAGPLQGLILAGFGGLDAWLLFGGNAVYLIYNAASANFRHSHVWLHVPAPFSLIFSTPAQHQIHHSRLPHHWDKNFGRTFALWDWMFGTLYNPTKQEVISFGLSAEFGEARPRPHPTLKAALMEPFSYLSRKRAEEEPAPPAPAPVHAE